jgi:hypothetical protein
MKKLTSCSFIFTIFVALFFFTKIHSYYKIEKENILRSDSITKIISVLENTNSVYSSQIENRTIWNTRTKEPNDLYTLLNESSTIIIRLGNTSCSPCNQKQIKFIEDLPNYNNILILSNVNNIRELRLFLHENKIKQTVYWIESKYKLFEEDDNTKVLVMYVNNNGTILRAYHLDEETFFLINSIIPR